MFIMKSRLFIDEEKKFLVQVSNWKVFGMQ